MKKLFLIFPDNLFEKIDKLNNCDVILIEHPIFFTNFNFHKSKLVLHRSSLKFYEDYLKKQNIKTEYFESEYKKSELENFLKKYDQIELYNFINHELKKEIEQIIKKLNLNLKIHENPQFLLKQQDLDEIKINKKILFYSFYIKLRKKLKILVKNEKPIGGKWSFDSDNREKITDENILPKNYYTPKENKFVKEAKKYIEKNFKNNYGTIDNFFYATTFDTAKKWLDDFLKNRLKNFGKYQDAILKDQNLLFHSILSPMLNIGLLTPDYIVEKTLDYSKKNKVPINSLEGFIRQIAGWREYVRVVYEKVGEKQKSKNFFGFRKKVPETWWKAETGILPIDNTIKKVLDSAYAHHIERLMILGNFMLLSEFKPNDVYKWFMELFIDAYDWVMIPNVYGMSQYSDGGMITTKPYISSSNYVLKMSNYTKNNWCNIWDKMFWDFLKNNKKKLEHIPRMGLLLNQLKKKPKN